MNDQPQPVTAYDSFPATMRHINKVQTKVSEFTFAMTQRAAIHDRSKLSGIELECLNAAGPQERTEVGSDAYKRRLDALRPMIQHHMANNSHHPEFYANGIDGMDLFDLVEMWCDWMAAAEERDPTGFNVEKSLEYVGRKHPISPQLASIFRNTAARWPQPQAATA